MVNNYIMIKREEISYFRNFLTKKGEKFIMKCSPFEVNKYEYFELSFNGVSFNCGVFWKGNKNRTKSMTPQEFFRQSAKKRNRHPLTKIFL